MDMEGVVDAGGEGEREREGVKGGVVEREG